MVMLVSLVSFWDVHKYPKGVHLHEYNAELTGLGGMICGRPEYKV